MIFTTLVGFIDPTYKKPISVNEFSGQVVYEEAASMIVVSNKFQMGSDEVNFNVYFGDIFIDEGVTKWKNVGQQNISLSGADVQNWGTDDSEVLYAIAQKIGTTIERIESVSFTDPYFAI